MNNFKNIKISDLPLHISDGNYSSKYPRADEMVSHGVPFIRANNLKNGTVIWEDMKYISSEKHEELQKGHLEEGDVLITVRGDIGKLSIVPRDFIDANINAQIALLRVYDRSKLDNKFLFYSLNTPNVIKQFNEKQTGTALKQLPIKSLREVSVLIPAIKEQKKIAAILSSVDAAIEKTEQVIAKTEEVKKGLMQQLLTKGIGYKEFKQTEIGEIPVKWIIKKLNEVATFSQGLQVPLENQYTESNNSNIRFLRIVDYTQSSTEARYIDLVDNKYIVKVDEVVMVRYGATAGYVGRGMAGVIANNLFRISPEGILLNDYLYLFLKQEKIFNILNKSTGASAMPAVNFSQVGNLKIAVPPLSEQRKIYDIVNKIEESIVINNQKLDKLLDIKKGLMRQLLTGQVRVKV